MTSWFQFFHAKCATLAGRLRALGPQISKWGRGLSCSPAKACAVPYRRLTYTCVVRVLLRVPLLRLLLLCTKSAIAKATRLLRYTCVVRVLRTMLVLLLKAAVTKWLCSGSVTKSATSASLRSTSRYRFAASMPGFGNRREPCEPLRSTIVDGHRGHGVHATPRQSIRSLDMGAMAMQGAAGECTYVWHRRRVSYHRCFRGKICATPPDQ